MGIITKVNKKNKTIKKRKFQKTSRKKSRKNKIMKGGLFPLEQCLPGGTCRINRQGNADCSLCTVQALGIPGLETSVEQIFNNQAAPNWREIGISRDNYERAINQSLLNMGITDLTPRGRIIAVWRRNVIAGTGEAFAPGNSPGHPQTPPNRRITPDEIAHWIINGNRNEPSNGTGNIPVGYISPVFITFFTREQQLALNNSQNPEQTLAQLGPGQGMGHFVNVGRAPDPSNPSRNLAVIVEPQQAPGYLGERPRPGIYYWNNSSHNFLNSQGEGYFRPNSLTGAPPVLRASSGPMGARRGYRETYDFDQLVLCFNAHGTDNHNEVIVNITNSQSNVPQTLTIRRRNNNEIISTYTYSTDSSGNVRWTLQPQTQPPQPQPSQPQPPQPQPPQPQPPQPLTPASLLSADPNPLPRCGFCLGNLQRSNRSDGDYANGWRCDLCNFVGERGTERWNCPTCNNPYYDACTRHFLSEAQFTELRNSRSAPLRVESWGSDISLGGGKKKRKRKKKKKKLTVKYPKLKKNKTKKNFSKSR